MLLCEGEEECHHELECGRPVRTNDEIHCFGMLGCWSKFSYADRFTVCSCSVAYQPFRNNNNVGFGS